MAIVMQTTNRPTPIVKQPELYIGYDDVLGVIVVTDENGKVVLSVNRKDSLAIAKAISEHQTDETRCERTAFVRGVTSRCILVDGHEGQHAAGPDAEHLFRWNT